MKDQLPGPAREEPPSIAGIDAEPAINATGRQ